jgi:hypothetical protein
MRKAMLATALLAVTAVTAVATSSSGAARHTLPPWMLNHPPASVKRSPASANRPDPVLATFLARARLATAKYVTNLAAAKADGYGIITKMIPDMGYHFMNPRLTGFEPTKPPILVYEKHGSTWQLGAIEWVFTSKPKTPPLPGATYGAFGAGCHYKDGSYVPAQTQDSCPKTAPSSGAAFNFWHPNLITLHVWLWYPNPSGLYSGANPLVQPFNSQ